MYDGTCFCVSILYKRKKRKIAFVLVLIYYIIFTLDLLKPFRSTILTIALILCLCIGPFQPFSWCAHANAERGANENRTHVERKSFKSKLVVCCYSFQQRRIVLRVLYISVFWIQYSVSCEQKSLVKVMQPLTPFLMHAPNAKSWKWLIFVMLLMLLLSFLSPLYVQIDCEEIAKISNRLTYILCTRFFLSL